MTETTFQPGDDAGPSFKVRGYWESVARRLGTDYVTVVFAALLALVVLAAVLAPWLTSVDPNKPDMMMRLKPIGTAGHLLGTDELGRDMLARLLYGGRVSLLTGVMPVVLATVIGGFLGVVAGYAGGVVNTVIMRTMDVFYAFPSVLLAVAVSGMLGGGLLNGLLALTLVFIPPLCRITETATTQVRNLDFVEAAIASGADMGSIVWHHVLGNILGPVFIYGSSLISISILLASGLSFLGLGVEPPTPDWGLMLSALRQAIYVDPVLCALPGVAIFITSLAFNMVSDGLRQAMDIKL